MQLYIQPAIPKQCDLSLTFFFFLMVTHAQNHHSEPSVIHAGCKYTSPYWQNLGVHLRALISFPPRATIRNPTPYWACQILSWGYNRHRSVRLCFFKHLFTSFCMSMKQRHLKPT